MKNTKPVLLSMPEEIGIGFLAGVASRAITTPLSVVTVRLQTATEDDNEDDEFREEERNPELAVSTVSTLQVIHDIYLEDGIKGLWRGRRLKSIGTMPEYTLIPSTQGSRQLYPSP